ncbi:hypothetical protein WJX74_001430 [Apatococcus lobatus]|uniref:Uncharacterized protein n=1 Tax=Apatococcus lobatus TaxID=904363 RepID=A0AAW1QT62_9CHLO
MTGLHTWRKLVAILLLASPTLQSDGIRMWSPQNPALPEGCYTYHQRYQAAQSPAREFSPPAEAKLVVLLKVHRHALIGIKQDLLWALEALAEEVQSSGYDFHILYEVQDNRTQPEGLSDRLWKSCYLYDSHDIFHKYKAIPNLVSGENFNSGPGPRGAQLPMTWFMYDHPGYKFAWVMEYDVRLIGHWGQFLDAALQLAQWTPKNPWHSADEGSEKSKHTRALAEDPPPTAYPDLVTFWPYEEHEHWIDTRVGMEGPNMYSLHMVWGGSRDLFDRMHDYSMQGRTAYYEVFMATIARHHGMKYVSIPHAIWTEGAGPESYHCCIAGAPRLYTDWYHGSHCAKLTLVHPVKLVEDFWPSV